MDKPTCKGCMWQRFVMTEQGQAWFCRRIGSDRHLNYEADKVCWMEVE